jgi:hypothetical protein
MPTREPARTGVKRGTDALKTTSQTKNEVHQQSHKTGFAQCAQIPKTAPKEKDMASTFTSFDALKHALAELDPREPIWVELTPELAAEILAHDPVNRKIRPGNLAKITREIEGGFWDPLKSPPIRFLPTMRLADGQHRCRAVVASKIAIVVPICIVQDTIGVDEGAARTLFDHLQLIYGLDEPTANLASVVTKSLCHVPNAGNREYLAFFEQQRAFIMECAKKPQAWLAEHTPSVAVVFKPAIIAALRAHAIHEKGEPAESVDQLLNDAINGGATAPEGSPRRALAKQFFDGMHEAFSKKKKTKRVEMLDWLLAALKFEREGALKNILTARGGQKKKRVPKAPPAQMAAE